MTTIAFDGKTLAIDRAIWRDSIWNVTCKLHVVELCEAARLRFRLSSNAIALAYSGMMKHVPLILDWMEKGGDLPKISEDDVLNGMVVEISTGEIFLLSELMTLCTICSIPIAAGAGGEVALGAMLAGADAEKAVRLVNTYTDCSNGGVDTFKLPVPWSPHG